MSVLLPQRINGVAAVDKLALLALSAFHISSARTLAPLRTRILFPSQIALAFLQLVRRTWSCSTGHVRLVMFDKPGYKVMQISNEITHIKWNRETLNITPIIPTMKFLL